MRIAALAAGTTLALTGVIFAQSPSSGDAAFQRPSVTRQVQDDLQRAGFTDVRMRHQALVLEAKDAQGRPVTIVINPQAAPSAAVSATDGSGLLAPSPPREGTTVNVLDAAPRSEPARICRLLPRVGDRCS